MDDGMIDLRGQRKRLTTLGVAAVLAVVVTIGVMWMIDAASDAPNADPVGASTRPLLAIAVFIVSAAWIASLLTRLQRR